MLAQLGETAATSKHVADGIAYLRKTQHPEGSWYGRWGMNFIYGTWSVLCALNMAGVDHKDPMIRRAAAWLTSIQNEDGGWGARTPSATGWTTGDGRLPPRRPRKRHGPCLP